MNWGLIIWAGAALVVLGMLAGALWVALRRGRELGKLVSVAKESRDNYFAKFQTERQKNIQLESTLDAERAEFIRDMGEARHARDKALEGVAGEDGWAVLMDAVMHKLYQKHAKYQAEIGALKDKLAKAERDAEAANSGLEAKDKGMDILNGIIADLEAELALRQAQGGAEAPEPKDAVMGVLEKFAGDLDIAVVDPQTGEARKLDA